MMSLGHQNDSPLFISVSGCFTPVPNSHHHQPTNPGAIFQFPTPILPNHHILRSFSSSQPSPLPTATSCNHLPVTSYSHLPAPNLHPCQTPHPATILLFPTPILANHHILQPYSSSQTPSLTTTRYCHSRTHYK